ncbi:MAG: aldo/keto reductase [Cyclobacteriaceae bacterium]|nr:aldo/keto reductase [Cyclobacteriaceae bacterium]
MEYRVLGKTGIKISRLSFGASSLGGIFHPVDTGDGIKAVHAALDYGINLIDCSPYYGDMKAENMLGSALRDISRDRFFLSTKVGRYWHNGEKSWDYSAGKAVKSVDESLKRLKVDHIDFIYCHDIEFARPEQIIQETLPALHRLKETGKVRFVGITGLPLRNFRYIIDHSAPGLVELVLTFCHYTLQDDSLVDYLDYFEKKNVGVINASPLSMGLLSEKGAPDWQPAGQEIREICQKAAQFCHQEGIKIEKLALQFSVHHNDVPTTLVGTSSADTIVRNIQWIGESMDMSLLQAVLAILKPIHRKTWKNS